MADNFEFKAGDAEALQAFVRNDDPNDALVIVAGNPRIQAFAVGAESRLLCDDPQSSAVEAGLGLYNRLVTDLVLEGFGEETPDADLTRELTSIRNWAFFVRGGSSHKASLPKELLKKPIVRRRPNFLRDFTSQVAAAKQRVKLAVQLDHNSGSTLGKFLTGPVVEQLIQRYGGSISKLKAAIEGGELPLDDMTVRSFLSKLRQGVFRPHLENSLAHSGDVRVVPEAVIRGYMNRLARDEDWGEEVNRSLSGPPYCLTRNIFAPASADSEDLLTVACPGVVAGTAGLLARDVLKVDEGGRGRILMLMQPDGIRVNAPEVNGGLWFYNERMSGDRAPARFLMTPNPALTRLAQFELRASCK